MGNNEFSNKSEGFNRYILGPEVIINSRTWEEAINKATQKKRKYRFIDSNYPFTKTKIWKEYQFLFLCTFIEFRLAELIAEKRNEIDIDKLRKWKCFKKVDDLQEIKNISPRYLLIEKRFNFGSLVDIINGCMPDLKDRNELVKQLKEYGKIRNTFIHHSFSSKTNNSYILREGITLGKKVLYLLKQYSVQVDDI